MTTQDLESTRRAGIGDWLIANVGRLAVSVFVPLLTFIGLWQGFIFLRDSEAPQWLITIIAIIWGVGGVAALYFISNWFIEQLTPAWMTRLQPFIFVGPAIAILFWYLALPTVRTLYRSFFLRDTNQFVGLQNYIRVFTERQMLEALRNNVLWVLVGSTLCVVFGVAVAVLADRTKIENVAKALIFLPMAISFIGAGVIWRFVYDPNPSIGLLNGIVTGLGGIAQAWMSDFRPWNNFLLIIILIWMQTGYAMVLISAAIKGVPHELLEAARVDGANEFQAFFRIIIPYIQGTLITVSTTIVIFTLKIFDIVLVMTGGNFGTTVIGVEFYQRFFIAGDLGIGSAIAIVLFILVIPVMIYNLREFSQQEVF
jgi:alpha-glucoside transport system permease protein